jgi:hypothetical protein
MSDNFFYKDEALISKCKRNLSVFFGGDDDSQQIHVQKSSRWAILIYIIITTEFKISNAVTFPI